MSIETSLFYDLKIIYPTIAVAVGGAFSLLMETFVGRNNKHKILPWINISFLALAVLILKSVAGDFSDPWNLFALNPINEFFLYSVLFCAFLGSCALQNTLKERGDGYGEAYSLLMLSATGIMLMVMATDLIPLFLGMELASFPIYALVAMNRNSKESNEAAFKYFISGSLFSAVFLYGIALFYGSTGSTLINGDVLAGRETIYQAAIFMLSFGLLFKVGAFPLHFWVADTYTGAFAAVTGYMAAIVKIGTFLALGTIWLSLFSGSVPVVVIAREAVLFLFIGLVSIVVGTTGLIQVSAKRILAFSAIANAGFILLGFCYPYFANIDILNLNDAFYFLLTYAIGSIGALTGISALIKDYDNMEDLRGVAKRNHFIGICVSVCLASLAGLPIAAGFLAKFRIFAGLVQASFENSTIWALAIAAFVLAISSAAYYIRIMYFMWSNTIGYKKHLKVSSLLNVGVASATLLLLILAVKIPF